MPDTLTPVIPGHEPIVFACPDWCTGCDTGVFTVDHQIVDHGSETQDITLSCGPVDRHFGDMGLCLHGETGGPQLIVMARDEVWAYVTIEEAEQLIGVLSSLVKRARAAKFRPMVPSDPFVCTPGR